MALPFSLSNLQSVRADLAARREHRLTSLRRVSNRVGRIESACRTLLKVQLRELEKNQPDHPFLCSYSLFGPIAHGRRETAFTQGLARLLDPRISSRESEPEAANALAWALLELVHEDAAEHRACVVIQVEAERRLKKSKRGQKDKRLDLWVQGKWEDDTPWNLAIEAKIDASESDNQLETYAERLNAEHREWTGVYLTPRGHKPESAGDSVWMSLSIEVLAASLAKAYSNTVVRRSKRADFCRLFIAGLYADILEHEIPMSSDGHIPLSVLHSFGRTLT